MLALLDRAIDGARGGEFAAIVTAPVHKGVINDAGVPFTGHTEYLRARTRGALPVMMLAADELRVALATTHLPLKDVQRRDHHRLAVRDRHASSTRDLAHGGASPRRASPSAA